MIRISRARRNGDEDGSQVKPVSNNYRNRALSCRTRGASGGRGENYSNGWAAGREELTRGRLIKRIN